LDTDGTTPKVEGSIEFIGEQIQQSLLEGQAPDDEHIIKLLIIEIKKQSENPINSGWVLVDFPRTKAQAQLFEKELSGYEEPKPIKLGNLHRSGKEKTEKTENETHQSVPKKRSLIAPPGENSAATSAIPAVSELDAVILLDVSNETAFRRAAGRRLDPVSGIEYHLEFNPPPDNILVTMGSVDVMF
jgi:adenylate kinase family enzyme